MAKRIYNMWKMKLPGMCKVLTWMAVIWLISVGFVALVVNVLDKEATYVTFATFMMFIVTLVFHVIYNIFAMGYDFNMAISMGATRKEFYVGYVATQMIITAIYVGLTVLSYHVERGLYKMWYPTREYEEFVEFINDWRIIIILIVLLPTFGIVFGAIFHKLSAKGNAAFWIIWLLCVIVLPQGLAYIKENPESAVSKAVFGAGSFLMNLPALFQILSIIVAATMFFLLGMLLLRKEAARI